MLHPRSILRDPRHQARGGYSEVLPNAQEKRYKWLPHPCLLEGPEEGANAKSPLHCRGSPTPSAGRKIRSGPKQRGTKFKVVASTLPSRGTRRGRKCYVTPAFSGVPNAKRGKENQKWSPTKGNKIGGGCLTPAFSRGPKRVQMLRHPCIVGGPQRQARGGKLEVVPNKGEQNWKWLPRPCLLEGPQEGGNATSPLHSRGSPTPSAGRKIRSGPQQRGTKLEVAASLVPSWGPSRGRKCYITPAFSRVPNAKRGEEKQKWSPTQGKKLEVAASPLPSWGPEEGGNATSVWIAATYPVPSSGHTRTRAD